MNPRLKYVCWFLFIVGVPNGHKLKAGDVIFNSLANRRALVLECLRCGKTTSVYEGSTLWKDWERGRFP